MATEAQMLVRMNGSHVTALRRRVAGERDTLPSESEGTTRGLLSARRTLYRWGAFSADGKVTDIGRRLLAAWDAREQEALAKRRRVANG
jgi:hypothetical protein